MDMSAVLDQNAKARDKKKAFVVHHVEIHPEKDARGNMVKGGGHTVKTVMHEKGEEYGARREAEKPFGAGDHENMLAHVANELKLQEPQGGEGGAEPAGEESGQEAAS